MGARYGFCHEVYSWFGVLAPAGTPRSIVGRFSMEIAKIITVPASRDMIIGAGFVPISNTPDQFAELIKEELERWGKVIRNASIKVE